METYELEYKYEPNKNFEINVTKMMLNKPYLCKFSRLAKIKDTTMIRVKNTQVYQLNINLMDQIFDLLWKDGLIKLT